MTGRNRDPRSSSTPFRPQPWPCPPPVAAPTATVVGPEAVTILCVTTWTRPYHDPLRVLTGSMVVFGAVFFTFAAITAVAQWREVSFTEAVIISAFGSAWLTFTSRLHRTALLVGVGGVRVRWLLRTRTIPWHDIREFSSRRKRTTTRLFIVLVDGTTVPTRVQRVQHRLFGSALSDGGTWLLPEPYDRLLRYLQSRRAAAKSSDPLG